jgi:hypothetical protein
MRQRCVCETCGEVFLDIDALRYLQLHHFAEPILLSVIDVPIEEMVANLGANVVERVRKFDKWFVLAMRHWIKNPTHDIIVSAPIEYLPDSPLHSVDIVSQHKIMYEMFGARYLEAQKYLLDQAWEESFPI